MVDIIYNLERDKAALKVALAESNAALAEVQATMKKTVAVLTAEVARLREQVAWFKRQVFGAKSERVVEPPRADELLPNFVLPEAPAAPPATVEVPRHQRLKPTRAKTTALDLPDDLERVDYVIDVPEAERTLPDGTALVKIGEDVTEKLAYRERQYFVRREIRPRYAAPGRPALGVVQEPASPSLIAGGKFDDSFLAHLVIEKYAYHLPLYRIEERLAQWGIRVSRQTLSQLLQNSAERAVPLYELMTAHLLAQGYVFTDDTTVLMQAAKHCRITRVWIYLGGGPNAPPYHVYVFSPDRSERHPLNFLANYHGKLHADAFSAYEKLDGDPARGITWAACWAHARRKFENAQSGDPDLRSWVLRQMRYLFLFERVAWARPAEERLRIRQEREKPLADALFRRLREVVASGDLLPQAGLTKAIGYLYSRQPQFRRYLDDPWLRMDNNPAERALRKVAVGRKNWLFVGSEKAGHHAAVLLSLVQTCRALGINPQAYLSDIFPRLLDHPFHRLAELLPDRWQAARTAAPAAAAH